MFDFSTPPAATPVALQQHPMFTAALGLIGVEAMAHVLPGGRAEVMVRRWPGLGRVGLISRGPVWAGAPRVDALAGLRCALGVTHLVVNADTKIEAQALGRAGFIQVAAPRAVAEVSLDGGPDAWLARMDGKWRNRLRHAQRQGLELRQEPFPASPYHWLLAEEAAQQKALGYRALPRALTAAMAAADPGALQLFTARRGGRTVAAMLFACHGGAASYHVGWTGPVGRKRSAHQLLLWEAMGRLAEAGITRLDLGGIDARAAPGLARFKTGSGAATRRLGGTWLDSAALTPVVVTRRMLARLVP